MSRVEGRGRMLVQAVLRLRRERAGRILPNLVETPNIAIQGPGQKVGPHGLEERRLEGLQARGTENETRDINAGRLR